MLQFDKHQSKLLVLFPPFYKMECYQNYCAFSFSSDCSMCLIKSFGHCLLNDALNALNFMGLKFHETLENDFIVDS